MTSGYDSLVARHDIVLEDKIKLKSERDKFELARHNMSVKYQNLTLDHERLITEMKALKLEKNDISKSYDTLFKMYNDLAKEYDDMKADKQVSQARSAGELLVPQTEVDRVCQSVSGIDRLKKIAEEQSRPGNDFVVTVPTGLTDSLIRNDFESLLKINRLIYLFSRKIELIVYREYDSDMRKFSIYIAVKNRTIVQYSKSHVAQFIRDLLMIGFKYSLIDKSYDTVSKLLKMFEI